MASKPLVSLLMTLAIVIQLARTDSLSQDSTEHTTTPKKNESSYLYLIGGTGLKYWSLKNSTSRLTIATGEWKSMEDMPTARNDFCGAVVGKKIYLFGGMKELKEMNSNDVYDCLTDTYTPLPPMPDYDIRGCAAAVLEQSIYVSGGEKPDGPRGEPTTQYKISDSLLRFDTRINRWTTLRPMNKQRSSHQLIELGGLLYAIGGTFEGKTMEVYNTTTNEWSDSLSNSHYSLDEYGSATLHEGKIYSLGSDGFEVYSLDTDQWTNLTFPQFDSSHEKFSHRKLVSMNGKLWAVGGIADQFTMKEKLIENLHSYDPSTDRWTKEQQIDVRRTEGFSAFVVNL